MNSILLSIKPKWAAKIYSWEKTIEWRKTKPYLLCSDNVFPTVYFYECGVGVTGGASIVGFHDCSVLRIPDSLLDKGCVPADDLYHYRGTRHLYGWELGAVFKTGIVPITSFVCNGKNLKRPPQSWCYVEAKR